MPQTQLKEYAKKYNGKVAKLLTLGRDNLMQTDRYSYVEKFGFTVDDAEQLLQLANDMDIYQYDYSNIPEDEGIEFYGVIHAWYVLSELEVPQAKELFIDLIENCDDEYYDDWILEGFRDLIKPFRKDMYDYFEERSQLEEYGVWTRLAYIGVISDMLRAKEVDAKRVDAFIEKVLSSNDNDMVNAKIISLCIDEKLLHHHELIKKCFAREAVDIDYNGDLEDVEIEMGLREERETEREPTKLQKMFGGFKEMIDSNFGEDALENLVQPFVNEKPKVGRNDPCPCGSGKKYKKCCLNK